MRRVLTLLLVHLCLASALLAAPLSLDDIDCLQALERGLGAQLKEMYTYFGEPPTLVQYEQEYRRTLAARTRTLEVTADIAARLARQPLVFLGDTHTDPESQRNTSEVLRSMRAGPGELTLVIEWIDRSFQPEVDAFLAGELEAAALRETIRFDETWGFSWADYLPVLETARELGVEVLLVEHLLEKHELDQRDRDIAGYIAEHHRRSPASRYLVVYGCYHLLGPDHLPERLAALDPLDAMVVVGEAPGVYFDALRKVRDPELLGFARLDEDLYFVRNGTPVERQRSTRDEFMAMAGWTLDDFETRVEECPAAASSQDRFGALYRDMDGPPGRDLR